jgi:hypothetical protein
VNPTQLKRLALRAVAFLKREKPRFGFVVLVHDPESEHFATASNIKNHAAIAALLDAAVDQYRGGKS